MISHFCMAIYFKLSFTKAIWSCCSEIQMLAG